MSLLEVGHLIAQERAVNGDKISRPKNYSRSLMEIKKLANERFKNNG